MTLLNMANSTPKTTSKLDSQTESKTEPQPEIKTTVTNAQVKTAKISQSGNEEMGIPSKDLYYLLIITDKGQVRLNVGEKTYETVHEITKQ